MEAIWKQFDLEANLCTQQILLNIGSQTVVIISS